MGAQNVILTENIKWGLFHTWSRKKIRIIIKMKIERVWNFFKFNKLVVITYHNLGSWRFLVETTTFLVHFFFYCGPH